MRKGKRVKTESSPDGQSREAIIAKHGDLSLLLLTVVLVVFGVVMIFSASYYKSISDAGDPYLYLKRQRMWAALGFVGMWIVSKIDYHIWGGLYKIIPLLCVGLLALIFTPLGQEAGGVRRVPVQTDKTQCPVPHRFPAQCAGLPSRKSHVRGHPPQ